ncbi:MAG: phosphotransferase [Burkholderiales bacterium]|nr:phosphotransferase [Burkholderiales bacterium]
MSDSPGRAPDPMTPVTWADPVRGAAFEAWLAAVAPAHDLAPHTLRIASADASFRRYLRVDTSGGNGSLIVMDAPPERENCEPFVRIAALLNGAGLRAPQVLAWDEPLGFMLLTDLGQRTMMDVIDRDDASVNLALYQRAIDALVTWQRASRAGVLPAYDEALLRRELALFPEWYVARHRGVELTAAQSAVLQRSFDLIVQNNLAAPTVFVHRDFMPRNLMVHPADASGALGVLDFQDAVYGPITYDIASLMRDAFLSWDEEFVLDITVRYWQQARAAGLLTPDSPGGWGEDFGAFYRGVEWMGLQRHLKVAGIFARLTLRDGKPKYLADAPRFIGYIRATAGRYRELAPLLRLVDEIEGTQAGSGWAFGRV